MTRPKFALLTTATFVIVAVGFVLAARGCARAIWPDELACVVFPTPEFVAHRARLAVTLERMRREASPR